MISHNPPFEDWISVGSSVCQVCQVCFGLCCQCGHSYGSDGCGGVRARHLGELTRYLPFELVDAVLAETGRVERRLRDLPSRVGVYFVLGLALFPDLGYGQVWGKLVAGLAGVARWPSPTAKALRDLRRRLAEKPLSALFGVVAGPLAQPGTPRGQVRAVADRRF